MIRSHFGRFEVFLTGDSSEDPPTKAIEDVVELITKKLTRRKTILLNPIYFYFSKNFRFFWLVWFIFSDI